jgi:hypothetical protein
MTAILGEGILFSINIKYVLASMMTSAMNECHSPLTSSFTIKHPRNMFGLGLVPSTKAERDELQSERPDATRSYGRKLTNQ